MKKLNLKSGGIKAMLTKEQMKKITGGYGYGYDDCFLMCYDSRDNRLTWSGYVCGINTGELHKHCNYMSPGYWYHNSSGTTCNANSTNPDYAICGSYVGY